MKIKQKGTADIIYHKETKEYTLEIKGKEIIVEKWYFENHLDGNSDVDGGSDIISDISFLTGDEQDQLNDYILELK